MDGHPRKETTQHEPRDGKQSKNWGGGYSYEIDCWDQLERFLILGSEDGNLYDSVDLEDNVGALKECLDEDSLEVVDMIVDISTDYRSTSNRYPNFALAYCLQNADVDGRRAAARAVTDVCRTGSHILRLVHYIDDLGGWATLQRRAISNWYLNKDVSELAYQCVKYQSSQGWSHQDALRMAHPEFNREVQDERDAMFDWICGDWDEVDEYTKQADSLYRVRLKEEINQIDDPNHAADLIDAGELPREFVPGRLRSNERVWRKLLTAGDGMPLWAMVRNLNKMSEVGLFDDSTHDGDEMRAEVIDAFNDDQRIRRSGIHPIKILTGALGYKRGNNRNTFRRAGGMNWPVYEDILSALREGFYKSFSNVESADENFLLSLDVSGSMNSSIEGGLNAMQSAAALAMVRCRAEAQGDGSAEAIAFSSGHDGGSSARQDGITEFPLSPTDTFTEIYDRMDALPYARTNCALPMKWALENEKEVDTFIVYTDSETNVRDIHPHDALLEYREKMEIPAKLVVVGLRSSGFSIAHPDDPGTMDVVGWDPSMPSIINQFCEGLIV